MQKTLTNLLTQNKLQTCCVYYKQYHKLPQFESCQLIPKLLTTDQIYTPAIIDLLASKPDIKKQIIEQIDLAKAIIILEHLGQDPSQYENIRIFVLRKHYKSMMHQYEQWYVFQDKMCFNRMFIQWFCEEKKDVFGEDVIESIKFRNGLTTAIKEQIVKNPLYQLDQFTCTQNLIPGLSYSNSNCKQKQKQKGAEHQKISYLTLQEYNIKKQNVYFVDSPQSQSFQHMVEVFKDCSYIGFDAEYRCTSRYEQMGVALIQLATSSQIFLIDFLKLETEELFQSFFKWLLKDPNHVIVGHSVQGDIKFIQRTMKIQGFQGFVDISKLFKQKFPNQTQNSLPFMTSFILGKNLSKYEQRSNWNRRPLKQSQCHYAALDALICLKLYQGLKDNEIKLTEAKQKTKPKTQTPIIRKQNLIYRQNQQNLLTRPIPKFMIDSMLKKLCSLLRNLGIDAEYTSINNYDLMQQNAKKQQRIILTRDQKLLNKKFPEMPIYCIREKGDSDLMLEEIIREFHVNLNLFTPLSRCVKCNNAELELIDREEAMKYLNFQYSDNVIQEFWRCVKCKQIYWEGNQFKNAKKKFGAMAQS